MIYEPMTMHIHTCHQPGGSMEGHMYNARSLGMRYIRFTDHDTRLGGARKKNPITGFDFTKGKAVIAEKPIAEHGFSFFGDPKTTIEEGKITLKCTSNGEDYERCGAYFYSEGTKHTVSLIAEVSVLLGMKFKLSGDAHLYLDARLSQRPPDHKPAHYIYCFDDHVGASAPHTVRVPIKENEDGLYTLNLSDDLRELWEIGGLDNVFDTVLITAETRRGGCAEITLDKFEIISKYSYDGILSRQRGIAEEIGKRYGVKPFVTYEISGAGQHKNVFSTKVPVIDYADHNFKVSEWEAVCHVEKHGGIFAYNHPFENNKFKKLKELTPEEVSRYVTNEAAYLISTKLYGASLMEVGFTEGRGCFGLKEYLRLWDTLSLSGLFITGYGDSDSHRNHQGWFEGNNFASWVGVDENIPYPALEEEFIKSMKRGRLYMGDPVFLKFGVNFEADCAEMGDVVYSDKNSHTVRLKITDPNGEYKVRLIADAVCVKEDFTKCGEDFDIELDYSREYPLGFVRAEMYNADGRCIMLTNPIYFAGKNKYFGEIPKERLVEV